MAKALSLKEAPQRHEPPASLESPVEPREGRPMLFPTVYLEFQLV